METPSLTILSFGTQPEQIHQRTMELVTERFGTVEWLDASDAHPRGKWIWCVPADCELSLGVLMRVEGILEGAEEGVHFFPIEDNSPINGLRRTLSERFALFDTMSGLFRQSDWQVLFGHLCPFEVAQKSLAGIEEDVLSRGAPFETHPERVRSLGTEPKVDWKHLYLRSKNLGSRLRGAFRS